MDVKEIVNERLKRKYEFVMPFQEIAELENKKLEEVQSTAHIRGFRPGKVPMSLIKKRFGDAVRSNVLEEHTKSVLDEFLKSKDEKPVTEVNLDHVSREGENADFVFTVDYECAPQITDVDLSSVELEKFVADIDDDFMDEAVQDEMRRFPKYEDAPEGYAIGRGDSVKLNYRAAPLDDRTSQTDEESISVLVAAVEDNEKSRLDAKKFNRFAPGMFRAMLDVFGIGDHLIGLKAGDATEFELDVPEGALDPLSGKKAIFNVEITSIERKFTFPSEEEFARNLDYDSAAAYRLRLMADLKHYYDEMSKEILVEDLTLELNKKLEFDAPEALIDKEIDFQKGQLEDPPPSGQGSRPDESGSPESDSDASGSEADSDGEAADSESENRIRALAERRVKHFMFLEYLIGKHRISLESNDFLDFVGKLAPSEKSRSSMLARCQNDAAFRQNIVHMATTDKTTDFILELVKPATKKIPPEDMIKIHEEREKAHLLHGTADAG